MKNNIIVLVGESGSGKDYFANFIKKIDDEYNFIISVSTRPIRDGEFEGNPYNFVGNEYFKSLISVDCLIEWRSYKTVQNNKDSIWYYGVTKESVKDDKKYVVVLDIEGLTNFKKYFGDRVTSIYIYTDPQTREERARKRGGFDELEWNRRLIDDERVFSKHNIMKMDYIVRNYDLRKSKKEIKNIMEDIL